MHCAGARVCMETAIGFHHALSIVQVPRSRPVSETVVRTVLSATFGQRIEDSVDAEEFFATTTEGGVRVENRSLIVLEEHTVTREILHDLLRVVEVVAEFRRKVPEFRLFDYSA